MKRKHESTVMMRERPWVPFGAALSMAVVVSCGSGALLDAPGFEERMAASSQADNEQEGAWLGNKGEGRTTDWIGDAWINGNPFTAAATFTALEVRAKVLASPGKFKCAVYADHQGTAGALLAESAEVVHPSAGWHAFTLKHGVRMEAGRTYWLMIWSDDPDARVHAEPGGTLRWGHYPFGSWPNPVSLLSEGSALTYSIHALGESNCTAESDAEMCQRLHKDCDALTDHDNCGDPRTVTCGSCTLPQTCGGSGISNVCANSPSDAQVVVDGADPKQRMDGFGYNAGALAWDDGTLAPALDLLADEGGTSIWRVVLEFGADWEPRNDDNNPNTFNWPVFEQSYGQSAKFKSLWAILEHLQKKNAPIILLNFMNCLPAWAGGCTLTSSKVDEFVEMVSSMLYYARNTKHLRVDVVSPFNESDWNPEYMEGPNASPQVLVNAMSKLGKRLEALGMGDIRLLGPDTAQFGQATQNYIPAMLRNPQVMSKVDAFGVHCYGFSPNEAVELVASSAYPDRRVWVTEFGSPGDSWQNARGFAEQVLSHMEAGATASILWHGYDCTYEHEGFSSGWGLAYDADAKTYHPRHQFYTLAQVFRFVRPGAVRLGTTTSVEGLRVMGFVHPSTGDVTLVGVATNPSVRTLRVEFNGLELPASLSTWTTTSEAGLVRGSDVTVSGQSVTINVPEDGVFTVTSVDRVP